MNHLAIYGSTEPRADLSLLDNLLRTIARRMAECDIAVERSFADFLHHTGIPLPEGAAVFDVRPAETAGLALSIGGDGTFLSTVHMLADNPTPVMGINSGHLGYLSAAEMSEAAELVDAIVSGAYVIRERSLLAVTVIDPDGTGQPVRYGLNEVAVLRRDTASMITVDATLNGQCLASYHADGLIVSTPTGSTAYNLSAGGPIAAPDTGIWIITPVAPHTLNMRPLVVADTSSLTLDIESRSDTVLLSIDGKATPIAASRRIAIAQAPHKLRLALLPGRNFIDTLRTKLLWGV